MDLKFVDVIISIIAKVTITNNRSTLTKISSVGYHPAFMIVSITMVIGSKPPIYRSTNLADNLAFIIAEIGIRVN